MSDCRYCDTCGNVFSTLDTDARRMTVEEPVMKEGSAVGVQTVVRDACGLCFRGMNARAKQPLAISAAPADEDTPDRSGRTMTGGGRHER